MKTESIEISNEIIMLETLDLKTRVETIRNLEGPFVLAQITCENCLTRVNPLNPSILVNKRTVSFGSVTNVVLEPQCPVCGNFIRAEQFFHLEN